MPVLFWVSQLNHLLVLGRPSCISVLLRSGAFTFSAEGCSGNLLSKKEPYLDYIKQSSVGAHFNGSRELWPPPACSALLWARWPSTAPHMEHYIMRHKFWRSHICMQEKNWHQPFCVEADVLRIFTTAWQLKTPAISWPAVSVSCSCCFIFDQVIFCIASMMKLCFKGWWMVISGDRICSKVIRIHNLQRWKLVYFHAPLLLQLKMQ